MRRNHSGLRVMLLACLFSLLLPAFAAFGEETQAPAGAETAVEAVTETEAEAAEEAATETEAEAAEEAVTETEAEAAEEAVTETEAEAAEETTAETAAVEETAEEPAVPQDVVILYTSDVHCGIDKGFGYGGLQRIRETLEAEGCATLLVDDGDSIQGEPVGGLTKGEAIIPLMNEMHYDVAIPGNHEFDYGVEHFLELTEMADYPYISCNVNKGGELLFDPYIIKEAGGLKIAFVGVTTPATLYSSAPHIFQNEEKEFIYGFMEGGDGEELYGAVQKAADDARAEGADYVIVLAHCGNETVCHPWTYDDIISHTSGIDAFLDGHSHDRDQVAVKNKLGEEVPRSACGTKLEGIGYVRISEGKLSTGLWTWGNAVSVPALFGIENEMSASVKAVEAEMDELLGEEIAETAIDLVIYDPFTTDASGHPIRIVRRAETNLGDLCADAIRVQSGAQIGMINGGGVRVGIPAGKITRKDIVSVFPFYNTISIAEVTGQQLLDLLEWGVRGLPEESGGFMQVSGLSFEIDAELKSSCVSDEHGKFAGVEGEYKVRNVMVGDEPLDLEATYTLGCIDYILKEYGGGRAMLEGCKIVADDVMSDTEGLIRYIQENLGGVVADQYANPYGDGRIVALEPEKN